MTRSWGEYKETLPNLYQALKKAAGSIATAEKFLMSSEEHEAMETKKEEKAKESGAASSSANPNQGKGEAGPAPKRRRNGKVKQ